MSVEFWRMGQRRSRSARSGGRARVRGEWLGRPCRGRGPRAVAGPVRHPRRRSSGHDDAEGGHRRCRTAAPPAARGRRDGHGAGPVGGPCAISARARRRSHESPRQKPMRVAEFEEYLRRLQGFFAARTSTSRASRSRWRDRRHRPSLDVPRPHVDVAATGLRTIETAARHADGSTSPSARTSTGCEADRLRPRGLSRRAGGPGRARAGCFVQSR